MPLFRYDSAELRDTAPRFVEALDSLRAAAVWTADVAVWEELVLDWWAHEAHADARVEGPLTRPVLSEPVRQDLAWPPPRQVSRVGPVSLVHRRGLPADSHPYSYVHWQQAVANERLEILLAAQVELGCGGRPASRFGRVMLAAMDLASLQARAKLLVFSTQDMAERRRLTDQLAALRLATWESRPWLLVDLAAFPASEEHHRWWDLLEA